MLFPTQLGPGNFARMNLDRAEALRVSWILRVGVAMENNNVALKAPPAHPRQHAYAYAIPAIAS